MSDAWKPTQSLEEILTSLVDNYQTSSRLQQQVLDNIRTMADAAFPSPSAEVSNMTAGESTLFWADSQQLDVLRSQLNQVEQLNLAILRHLLEQKSQSLGS